MPDAFERVVHLPAVAAEIVETVHVPAEIGPLTQSASRAQSVLQVGINLDLQHSVKDA